MDVGDACSCHGRSNVGAVNEAWVLLPVALVVIYIAAAVAVVTSIRQAFRERYLPAWVVGLAAAVVFGLVDTMLGNPLGKWGGILYLVTGIVAGAVYGLRQRRHSSAGGVSSGGQEPLAPGAGERTR